MLKKKLYIIVGFLLMFISSYSQNISGIVNSYAKVTSINGSTLTIENLLGQEIDFQPGKRILVIQMKGADIDRTNTSSYGEIIDLKEAGNYEIAVISSKNGTGSSFSITVYDLVREYDPNSFVQIVSIPQYINATVIADITASPWNPNNGTGGVLIIEVSQTLTLQANINVSGMGFRSGNFNTVSYDSDSDLVTFVNTGNNINGQKGEGIAHYGLEGDHGMGALANGGGGGNSHNAGGGGGGNYSSGGVGGDSHFEPYGGGGNGGKKLSYNASINKIFMGGGGGGGQQNENLASRGGDGGGIVFIRANTLNTNCDATRIISANGNNAPNTPGNDGGGGGGAGGAVVLEVTTFDLNCNISIAVNGGNGGNVSWYDKHAGGGGGGAGAILLPGSSENSFLNMYSGSGIPGKDCDEDSCSSTGTPGEPCSGNACTGENSWTINLPNNPPVAVDDVITTNEDVAVIFNVMDNDSDPDADNIVLTILPINGPSNGNLVLNGNNYTYTPNANYYGIDSFTYEICDNGTPSICTTAEVTINITAVNDAPIAMDNTAETDKNVPVTIDVLANDSDIEDDLLVVSATLITAPSHGNLVLNQDQTFTYTPNFNYVGSDSFIYKVCDDGTPSMCSSATVNIVIKNINYPPVAVDDVFITNEDVAIIFNVMNNDSDPDGDNIVLTILPVSGPSNGNLVLNGNNYKYTPRANYFGSDSFTYQICDNGTPSICTTAEVTINITAVNDAPIAMDN
nr:Ig-like domain-containing protein [Bacteroidota bacterium]